MRRDKTSAVHGEKQVNQTKEEKNEIQKYTLPVSFKNKNKK